MSDNCKHCGEFLTVEYECPACDYRPMHPRARIQKIIDECVQLIRDVSRYNDKHNPGPAIDTGATRVMLTYSQSAAQAWDSGDRTAFARLLGQLLKQAP